MSERADIISALTMTTIVLVGVIAASNWETGLVNDFSPGSMVVSETDGILPSGLASELVAGAPALADPGGGIWTETHVRSTEPRVNVEGLITGEPPSSPGADAFLVPSPTVQSTAGGNGGPSGTPGGGSGDPTTTPPTTSTPTPAPTPTEPQPGGGGADDDPTDEPTTTDPPSDPAPTTTEPPLPIDEPTVTLPPVPTDEPLVDVSTSPGPLP